MDTNPTPDALDHDDCGCPVCKAIIEAIAAQATAEDAETRSRGMVDAIKSEIAALHGAGFPPARAAALVMSDASLETLRDLTLVVCLTLDAREADAIEPGDALALIDEYAQAWLNTGEGR